MPRRRACSGCASPVLCALALGIFRSGALSPTSAPAAGDPAPRRAARRRRARGEAPRDALLVEISTAGYYELVARARELGLADRAAPMRSAPVCINTTASRLPAGGKRAGSSRSRGQGRPATQRSRRGRRHSRASGGVILTLVETNGDTHRIQADSIAYDRARSTLTARGSVRYERKSGTTTEIFMGDALSANLDDWSGVFIDGKFRSQARPRRRRPWLSACSPAVGSELSPGAS